MYRKKRIVNRICSASLSFLLLFCSMISVFADTVLPEGTAAGLPEKLTVTDSDGNAVNSETGEYFFCVENMTPGEVYSKNIQIMNLREDKAYHIYFYAQPLDRKGEIDLEEECTASFSLNNERIYEGKVTGEGNPDIRETPIDLGLYEPGQTGTLQCSIVWNGTDAGGFIDYGSKVTDKNGTEIIREGSGDNTVYGEVTFRWIFYAVVDEEYIPPKTGVLTDNDWLYAGAVITVGIMIVILLLLSYKKRQESKKKTF